MKKFEELNLTDDFMFCKVMQSKEICKGVLERILGFEIKDISYPDTQKAFDLAADARSVRLDVYTYDEENKIYNIEMQVQNTGNLPLRSRYYQSMIDVSLIEKGENYNKLNESFIIFICMFDLFGYGKSLYTFKNSCRELPEIVLGDKTTKVFLNVKGNTTDINPHLHTLLKYLLENEIEDDFIKKLDQEVKRGQRNKEWGREYMTLQMRDLENQEMGKEIGKEIGKEMGKEIGKEIGKEMGKEIGKEQERRKVALALIENGMNYEFVAKCTELTLDEVKDLWKYKK